MNNRVLLGMSGGVDSSVAAIILKNQGYEVVGVTMELLNDKNAEESQTSKDARNICEFLGLEHHTINLKDEFDKHVINDFIACYADCKTPNPCIECNKYLKFGAMWEYAKKLDCDYISTGHYAKIEYSEKYGQKVLKKANSIKKDQSYVLYNLPANMIEHLLLPLGDFYEKSEIREIASEYNLPVANKPDSEDICFIPDGDYKSFLENNSNLKAIEGNIVNSSGKILGKHTGLYRYTIGQRKGLGISNPVPLFVLGFNKEKNEVIVGEEAELYTKEFLVKDINFIYSSDLSDWLLVEVKTRYAAKPVKAQIIKEGEYIKVVFEEPQKSVTPGQSAVFYDDEILIGGGKII